MKKSKKKNKNVAEETVTNELAAEAVNEGLEEQGVLETSEEIVENLEAVTSEGESEVDSEAVEATAVTEETVTVEATPAVDGVITDLNEVESAVFAIVFASPVALSTKKIKNLLTHGGYDASQLDLVLESLGQNFENKGVQLVKVAGGYQFRTNPKFGEIVQKLVEEKPQRLSKSALEVLAIVSYKQPITRADIDHVRGTDSGHLLKSLLEKNLVRTEGHKESAGRPLLYGTTPYFLEVFTLRSLDDLPAIEDFERELKDADSENGDSFVLGADPGFFDKPSSLDAEADRGDFDVNAEDVAEKADFGVEERAAEEVNEQVSEEISSSN